MLEHSVPQEDGISLLAWCESMESLQKFSWSMNDCEGYSMQVEARLRQLEGKALASGAAQLGQRANQAAYNPQAQGTSAAIATTAKSYNPGADVTMNGALDKKEKVGCPRLHPSCCFRHGIYLLLGPF